ncbi:phage capsid protein [Asticcacaulis taihuensis]|uniref:phage capsid protein n=1 Tax=Asticcacaulis taihuensis TaxID=260084 RepID=UPI0026ED0E5A|nr:phage capsid protein [Asticcacaulis taihuensis]
MTQNVPNWFVTKFNDTVKHRAQQANTRLGGTVEDGGSFVGDKVYFPRMGAVEMYDSAAFARLALANAAQDFIEVSATPKFVAFGIWDAHKNKLSIPLAENYGRAAHMAALRAQDRIIRDVLNAAATSGVANTKGDAAETITTIGAYDTIATLDDIAEAIAVIGENEMFEGEEITCVMPFRHKINMSLDPYMAKADMNRKDLPWNDINWRTYQKLPTSGTAGDSAEGVDIFLYAKSAIISAYNNDLTVIQERDGAALTDIMGYWQQIGAAAREPKGIVRIKSLKNFSLYREPIPTHAVA